MKLEYTQSEGSILSNTDAKVVGRQLKILERESGEITPQLVVDTARSRTHPLHKYFTWDDTEAAEKCRLQEARVLICSVQIIRYTDKDFGKPRTIKVRAFSSLTIPDKGRCYISTTRALTNKEFREQLITKAYQELVSWKKRYETLKEFSEVVKAINKVEPTLVEA